MNDINENVGKSKENYFIIIKKCIDYEKMQTIIKTKGKDVKNGKLNSNRTSKFKTLNKPTRYFISKTKYL